jgi:hypothetical protein
MCVLVFWCFFVGCPHDVKLLLAGGRGLLLLSTGIISHFITINKDGVLYAILTTVGYISFCLHINKCICRSA